jgi:hypothetical protein
LVTKDSSLPNSRLDVSMLPEEVLKDVETLQHALGWEKYSAQPVASGTGEPVV